MNPPSRPAVVDSSAFFTPLAKRVRRYLVFLPPAVLLLVDEIQAKTPVRARLLFHYPIVQPQLVPGQLAPVSASNRGDARVTWDVDAFSITNGPAELRARMLCPMAADHLIIGRDERRTTYSPPTGLLTQFNNYLYVENLYRKPRLVFVTALQFGAKGFAPAQFALDGQPMQHDQFQLTIRLPDKAPVRIAYDLKQRHRRGNNGMSNALPHPRPPLPLGEGAGG